MNILYSFSRKPKTENRKRYECGTEAAPRRRKAAKRRGLAANNRDKSATWRFGSAIFPLNGTGRRRLAGLEGENYGVMVGGRASAVGASGSLKVKWRSSGFLQSTKPATNAASKLPPVMAGPAPTKWAAPP